MGWLYPLVGFIAFLIPVFRPPQPIEMDAKFREPWNHEDYKGTGAQDSFAAVNAEKAAAAGKVAAAPETADNKVLDEKAANAKVNEIEMGVQEGAVKA